MGMVLHLPWMPLRDPGMLGKKVVQRCLLPVLASIMLRNGVILEAGGIARLRGGCYHVFQA